MATASSCGQACACWAFSQVHGRSQTHGGKHRPARHSGTHLHIASVDLAHHRLPHAFQVQGRNLLWGGVPTDRGGEQRQAGRPLELVSKQVWWRRGVRALLHGTGPCFAAHAAHACSWSAVTDHPAASAFPPEAAVGSQHRVQDAVGGCTLQALAQRAVVAQVLWDNQVHATSGLETPHRMACSTPAGACACQHVITGVGSQAPPATLSSTTLVCPPAACCAPSQSPPSAAAPGTGAAAAAPRPHRRR